MLHSHTPQLKSTLYWLHGSALFKTCICSRAPHYSTALQNGQDVQNPESNSQERSIMEYSSELPQDTKPLRSCSENRTELLLKRHLWIKCHSQYYKDIRPLHHSFVNSSTVNAICVMFKMFQMKYVIGNIWYTLQNYNALEENVHLQNF